MDENPTTSKPSAAKPTKSKQEEKQQSSSSSASKKPVATKATTPKRTRNEDGYAIVEACGTQLWLKEHRYYDLDRLNEEVDKTVTLKNVLLVNDGATTSIGQPYVKGASVELKVMEHRRGPKLIVYKMRPKKKTRRKNGHRQELTRVMVQSISSGGKST